MRVQHSLGPIYTHDSKILILGSLPSQKSRELGFYYAHKQNRFWKVMQEIFNETIEDQTAFLNKHHIALYDVIESCEIKGSSDSSIKDVIPTDLNTILEHSNITTIFTTGKKAYDLYMKYQYPKTNIQPIPLPSTSPANAGYSFNQLVEAYKIILNHL